MRKGNWTNGMKTLRFLGFAFSFVCVLMLIIYFFHFNGKFAEKSADWANFGSYFGSITGLMAFLAVLFTAIQSEKRANKAETKTLLVEQEAKIAAKFAKQEADKREAKANEQAVKREERDLFFNMLKMYHRQADLITKNKSFFEFTKDEGLVMLVYIIYDSILKDKNFKLFQNKWYCSNTDFLSNHISKSLNEAIWAPNSIMTEMEDQFHSENPDQIKSLAKRTNKINKINVHSTARISPEQEQKL